MSSKAVKIGNDVHETLVGLSQKYRMNMGDIVGYLADLGEKYDLLDPDWIEPLVHEKVQEFLSKHDKDLAKRLEIERSKAINQAKLYAFKKYIDVLPDETRKTFLENILGNVNDDTFLDTISNYQMFSVDGKKRLFQVGPDGKPVIPGQVDNNDLVTCLTGYHNLGAYCECGKWKVCPIRQEEYLSYLSKTDPNMRRPETRRFANSYRRIEDQR